MSVTHLSHSTSNADEIKRNLINYSFQKDIFQGHKIEGDFLVDLILEKARVIQYLKQGIVVADEPLNENAYIGIAVHHASDYRFIHGLSVTLTVIDANGYEVGKQRHVFHPRPGLYHYGSNWILPSDGHYTLRVKIETQEPKWRESLGYESLPKKVEIDFPDVMIHTGQQLT